MTRTRKDTPDQEESSPGEGSPPSPNGAWRKWLVQLVLPLAAGGGLIAGLIFLGGRARDQLREEGEHTIAFADVECEPPEGLTRQEFLEEAQYLANLPDRINLLEPDANARIASGLAAHPWVAQVKLVEQLPVHRVRADLVYRVGVLAVASSGRTVDREGVLLPLSAKRKGLPVLRARVKPPLGGPGQGWADETVLAAAAVAGLLQPHLQELNLAGCNIQLDHGDLVLRTPRTRIVWGRGPGRERPDECAAREKVQRLLERPALDGLEHDLRPVAGVKRSLPRAGASK